MYKNKPNKNEIKYIYEPRMKEDSRLKILIIKLFENRGETKDSAKK